MQKAPTDTFLGFGGHEQAGGFSLARGSEALLPERLGAAHAATPPLVKPKAERLIDGDLTLEDVTWEHYREIELLAPFGEGNPKPLFRFRATPTASRRFGKKKEHLEVSFKKESGEPLNAVQFFAPESLKLKAGEPLKFLGHFEKNTFKRTPELRLRLVEVV